MNNWSSRRKKFIFLLALTGFLVLVGVPAGFLYYEPPTCFDGKQNGDEVGVDCGGSCELLCKSESLPIIPVGDPRVIKVSPGVYEIVAIVENPNISGRVDRGEFTIKLFEAGSITPLKIIESETYVPRSSKFVIFEGPFSIEEGVIPQRATLEWKTDSLVWEKDSTPKPNILVRDTLLTREETEPRVNSTVVNNSTEEINNIELVALISNEGGNIISASKTFVESLPSGSSAPIIFAWPTIFSSENVNISITYRVFPDKSFLK